MKLNVLMHYFVPSSTLARRNECINNMGSGKVRNGVKEFLIIFIHTINFTLKTPASFNNLYTGTMYITPLSTWYVIPKVG